MDKATITFLNALADMLGLLPQKIKPQKGGAIVKSQRGALTASPRGAITSSPRGAVTPATGGGAAQTGGGYQAVRVSEAPPRALPSSSSGSAVSGSGSRGAVSGGGARGALAAGSRSAGGSAGGLGAAAAPALLNALGMFLGGKILESAGSEGAANMSLLGGDAPVARQQPQRNAPQSESRQQATTTTQSNKPRQVKYPTAAETIAAAAPAPTATATPAAAQSQKDKINKMYMEARSKAMSITDPMQRQAALEGVTQMGLELHREYFGK